MAMYLTPKSLPINEPLALEMSVLDWIMTAEYLFNFYYGPHSGSYAPPGVNKFIELMKEKLYTPDSIKALDSHYQETQERMNPFNFLTGQVPLTPEQFEGNNEE